MKNQIKNKLIELAISGELPDDMTTLDMSLFDLPDCENVEFVEIENGDEVNVLCFDGIALGESHKGRVRLVYPFLSELTESMITDIMEYRYGGKAMWPYDTPQCEDIMMRYGQIVKTNKTN